MIVEGQSSPTERLSRLALRLAGMTTGGRGAFVADGAGPPPLSSPRTGRPQGGPPPAGYSRVAVVCDARATIASTARSAERIAPSFQPHQ